jgi:hypothetical protein
MDLQRHAAGSIGARQPVDWTVHRGTSTIVLTECGGRHKTN